MILLQIHSTYPLAGELHNKYKGIASDGRYFYCTVPSCKEILRFDSDFQTYKTYPVCRSYSSICYDMCKRCFWGLSAESDLSIYQLDCEFNEIHCISLSFPGYNRISLTGVACGYSQDQLIITTSLFLARISKKSGNIICIVNKAATGTRYLCVEKLCSEYLLATCTNNQFELILTSGSGNNSLRCFLGCDYIPIDFTVQYIMLENYCCYLYILVIDACNCYHVLKCMVSDCNHECKKNTGQCCNDLIESIALVEASLAHILNAEGEKLQKVIHTSCDFYELLKTNQSVTETIKNVTELEKVLLAKLNTANQLYEK